MKLLKASLLLLIILVSCTKKNPEVTIKGYVKGDIPYTITYTSIINNTDYIPFKKVIIPDSLGNFQIKIPLEKTTSITVIIDKKNDFKQITKAKLIIEPNKEYILNFDLRKKDMIEIKGFNKIAQQKLNKLENPIHIQEGASPYFKDSITSNIVYKIDSLKQAEIMKFKKLYQKDSISKSFFEVVKLDRDYYYTALKGTVGFINFLTNERKKDVFTEEFKEMWKSCFENDLLNRSDFKNTEWSYAFIENYLYYKSSKLSGFNLEKLKSSMKGVSKITYSIHQADSLLPKERLEFYKASFLFNNLIQKKYEKELISVFNQLKDEFPNSSYIKYLEPMVDDVLAFHETVKQPFSKSINFIENYNNLNNFKDVLKPLKGQKLYIDFWATWCGPCKREFKHNKDLKVLLKKYGYKATYISIDREKNHQEWLNMIKFYDLEGFHLRTNKTLSKQISDMGVNYIPRYFLVNEKGDVIEKNANSPSKLKELENQLIEFNN